MGRSLGLRSINSLQEAMTRPRFDSWIPHSLLAVLTSTQGITQVRNLGISSQFLSVPNTHYKSSLEPMSTSGLTKRSFSSLPFGPTTPSMASHVSPPPNLPCHKIKSSQELHRQTIE